MRLIQAEQRLSDQRVMDCNNLEFLNLQRLNISSLDQQKLRKFTLFKSCLVSGPLFRVGMGGGACTHDYDNKTESQDLKTPSSNTTNKSPFVHVFFECPVLICFSPARPARVPSSVNRKCFLDAADSLLSYWLISSAPTALLLPVVLTGVAAVRLHTEF